MPIVSMLFIFKIRMSKGRYILPHDSQCMWLSEIQVSGQKGTDLPMPQALADWPSHETCLDINSLILILRLNVLIGSKVIVWEAGEIVQWIENLSWMQPT